MIPVQIDVNREKRFYRAVEIGNTFHLHDARSVDFRGFEASMGEGRGKMG